MNETSNYALVTRDSMRLFADELRKRTSYKKTLSFPNDFITLFSKAKFTSSITISSSAVNGFLRNNMPSFCLLTDKVKEIPDYRFYNHSELMSIYAPGCRYVGSEAFNGCNNLHSIYFPECNRIDNSAFINCYKISTLSLPECLFVGNDTFMDNVFSSFQYDLPFDYIGSMKLNYISLPKCSMVGTHAFAGCSILTDVYLPKLESVQYATFLNCSIDTLILSDCSYIEGYAFMNATISNLYLYGSSYVNISPDAYGIYYKQFTGERLYVPESLYDYYIFESTWSDYWWNILSF